MRETPETKGYQTPEQRAALFNDPLYLEGFLRIEAATGIVRKKATAFERQAREARTRKAMGEYATHIEAAARIREKFNKIELAWDDASLDAEQRKALLNQLDELIS